MGAPLGNKHAVGNKGGGRKSAYAEMADAQRAFEIFFNEQNQEELEAKISSGKFALVDRFKLNAMEGDQGALNQAIKKAIPDAQVIEHKGEVSLKLDL